MTLESVDEVSFIGPDFDHLIVGASSESQAGNFNYPPDNVVVGFELLLFISLVPDMHESILTSSKGDSIRKSKHSHSVGMTF